MIDEPGSGNMVCYLDGRSRVDPGTGVGATVADALWAMPDHRSSAVGTQSPARAEARWFAWGRSIFASTVVVLLMVLGAANIAVRGRWHEVEDGVLWSSRAEGITAVEIATGSSAE